jgi:hypothetical protein
VRTGKWLAGIPEWEASNASRRNLSHAAAVRECAHLTTQYRKMGSTMAHVIVELDQVIQALTAKKIPFVLTGAHGGGAEILRLVEEVKAGKVPNLLI